MLIKFHRSRYSTKKTLHTYNWTWT